MQEGEDGEENGKELNVHFQWLAWTVEAGEVV